MSKRTPLELLVNSPVPDACSILSPSLQRAARQCDGVIAPFEQGPIGSRGISAQERLAFDHLPTTGCPKRLPVLNFPNSDRSISGGASRCARPGDVVTHTLTLPLPYHLSFLHALSLRPCPRSFPVKSLSTSVGPRALPPSPPTLEFSKITGKYCLNNNIISILLI